MDWFSKHTQWLFNETQALTKSSIYQEKHQCIHNTLISTGNMVVHKDKTYYHPILFVYPESTPYTPPLVYILENEIDQQTATDYSTRTPDEIRQDVKNNIRFLNRRHQNEDGSVCIIETGDLHSEVAEIFTIKDIIKRLRIWLSGKIPKDSREVELFNHFPKKTDEIQILITDLFFNTEICKGKFFAGLSNILDINTIAGIIDQKVYIGITIFGENSQGITIPPKQFIKKQLILFTPAPNVIELIKSESRERETAIKDGKLIEGYWWDIKEEPIPFSSVESLSHYIGENAGVRTLINDLKEPLKKLYEKIVVALRFPGRWREKDWQFFLLKKGVRPPILDESFEEYKERLFNYTIEAVRQEYFTENNFHLRNTGRADRNILRQHNISLIGCGALGSETADSLSKAGIGRIYLIDRGNLKAHNTVRHTIGLNRIALPKVLGLAEHIAMHNPFVEIGSLSAIDITKSEIHDYLPQNSIGLSTIADDNLEAYLNEKAVENNRIVFYCRALRGGKAARIFRVIPGKDACKSCLALYHSEDNTKFIDIEEDEILPVITNECNNPVRPASAADMKAISGIFSRIVIDHIQSQNMDINHWIWSTEELQNLPLYIKRSGSIFYEKIPPHPDCSTCQPLDKKTVTIPNSQYSHMKMTIDKNPNVETGGILIGWREANGKYFIKLATGPGPNAVQTEALFEKDDLYCQDQLEESLKKFGDKGLYIGEWHYHPTGSHSPSGRDIKSLTDIANQKQYKIDKPIMIILSKNLECALTIHDKHGSCVNLDLEISDRE